MVDEWRLKRCGLVLDSRSNDGYANKLVERGIVCLTKYIASNENLTIFFMFPLSIDKGKSALFAVVRASQGEEACGLSPRGYLVVEIVTSTSSSVISNGMYSENDECRDKNYNPIINFCIISILCRN